MLDLFNIPTPQSSNYQEFYGGGSTFTWVKPRGASMVRFMLIGAGGGGGNGTSAQGGGGGGSGGVTSWIGPAIFIPDSLRITTGQGGTSGVNATASSVIYQAKNGTGYTLLSAFGGSSGSTGTSGGSGGSGMTANYFTSAGIFNSLSGQSGANGSSTGAGGNQSASTSTFLSGGAGGSGATASTGGSVTPTYGYLPLPVTTAGGSVVGANGYFITNPVIVGCGGAGGSTSTSVGTGGGRGGIGCGGGGSGEDGNLVGPGMVLIASW